MRAETPDISRRRPGQSLQVDTEPIYIGTADTHLRFRLPRPGESSGNLVSDLCLSTLRLKFTVL